MFFKRPGTMAETGVMYAPAGTCVKCFARNGELEDVCRSCGAKLGAMPPTSSSSARAFGLSTPIKSPEYKRAKGDEQFQSDDMDTAPPTLTPNAPQAPLDAGGMGAGAAEKPEVTDMFQTMMNMMSSVKKDVADMRTESNEVKKTITEASANASEALRVANDAHKSVNLLTKAVDELQLTLTTKEETRKMITEENATVKETLCSELRHSRGDTTSEAATAVFGGLDEMSFQAAEEWIERKMKECNLPETRELYHKGDMFNGIIFAKYSNIEDMRQVVQKMQRSSFKLGQKQFWCKPDRSLELRAQVSFLLGLRRQLILWESQCYQLQRRAVL